MSRLRAVPSVLLACLAATLWLSACDDLAEPTVLTIGTRTFTARSLRDIHGAIDASQRPPLATPAERLRFVDRVVERTLLAEHASALIGRGELDAQPVLERLRDDALIRRLRVLEGAGVALDTTTVALAYERMRTLYHVQGLLFPNEREASEVVSRLGDGAALRDLPEFLGDASLDTWVSWSPMPDPIADLVEDAEPGQVIGPVPSRNWWRVLQVVDRRPADLEPYETLRPRILRGLRLRAESEGIGAVLDRLLPESDLIVHEDAIQRLAEHTRRAILAPGATENDAGWALPQFESEDDFLIAEWKGGSLRKNEYTELINSLPRGQRPRSSGLAAAIRAVVTDHVERRLLVREAKRRGLESDRWVKRQLRTQEADRMVQWAVADLEQAGEQSVATDSLIAALRESQPNLFYREPRARVLRFDLPTRAAADHELAAIRAAGGGLPRLEQLLLSETPAVGGYHLMDLTRGSVNVPGVEEAVFDEPVGSVSGPYELVGSWAVIACIDREPARLMTDDDLRESLGRQPGGGNVVDEWIQARIAEVGVTVDEAALGDLRPGG
ncbi:MAG: hypothetical protein DHS20C21_02730 [Gemmatimonadota bacterium]|nr:MAG: hypothetical protein DHS20C21_02730 [Gemmatimonadota bacterium]